VAFHQVNWARIGLNVVLYENRMVTLAERTQILNYDADNGAVHIYDATWLVGSNPNPRGLWGNVHHNGTRYESAELTAIFDAIESEDGWDRDWLISQYHAFQRYVYTNATWIPVSSGYLMWTANNRVLNFSLDRDVPDTSLPGNNRFHLWDLSAERAYSAR